MHDVVTNSTAGLKASPRPARIDLRAVAWFSLFLLVGSLAVLRPVFLLVCVIVAARWSCRLALTYMQRANLEFWQVLSLGCTERLPLADSRVRESDSAYRRGSVHHWLWTRLHFPGTGNFLTPATDCQSIERTSRTVHAGLACRDGSALGCGLSFLWDLGAARQYAVPRRYLHAAGPGVGYEAQQHHFLSTMDAGPLRLKYDVRLHHALG